MFGPKIDRPHSNIRNCIIPHELFYDIKNHFWLREEKDGTWTIGLTDMAQTAGGKVLHFKPWKRGVKRKANKPVAMLEAAKWLGIIRVPFATTIVDFNEELLENAYAINQYPYTKGWIVRILPEEETIVKDCFLTGEEAAKEYKKNFDIWGLADCVHCLGFEV
jgi:glycine cleavage system H protein